jgi:hypothetical protein
MNTSSAVLNNIMGRAIGLLGPQGSGLYRARREDMKQDAESLLSNSGTSATDTA